MKTLYDKLWDGHIVANDKDNTLLYIDRHLIHEVTSPQAFEGMRLANRKPWRKQSNLAVSDHNVPTTDRDNIVDKMSKLQIDTLGDNCSEYDIQEIKMDDIRQGIVHIIGPEQGLTLPGTTIVCGDSHTSTHGALGALAFGIGTSEVEHVLVTQCLWQKKSKNMLVKINGKLNSGVESKDLALYLIGKIGTAGGTGYAIEFAGSTIKELSIEARMTLCNMAIEAGARVGLVAVDDKTIDYITGRPFTPKGNMLTKAISHWQQLHTDSGAIFDKTITINANNIKPQVTWGTSPELVVDIDGEIPNPELEKDKVKSQSMDNALKYMGLKVGQKMSDIKIDKVFIGSCTNARIEDIRNAAKVVKGKHIAKNIKLAMVVSGSGLVKQQAEKEGLDKIFIDAGFEWRLPGCSMCLAMNADKLEKGERCASTSNRNFEGRQGAGGRTHLVSPTIAAASAIVGRFSI